jgi:MoxR-like ATPase
MRDQTAKGESMSDQSLRVVARVKAKPDTVREVRELLERATYGNRHGLVAGATGTGKSVTLLVWPRASRGSACRCSSPT